MKKIYLVIIPLLICCGLLVSLYLVRIPSPAILINERYILKIK